MLGQQIFLVLAGLLLIIILFAFVCNIKIFNLAKRNEITTHITATHHQPFSFEVISDSSKAGISTKQGQEKRQKLARKPVQTINGNRNDPSFSTISDNASISFTPLKNIKSSQTTKTIIKPNPLILSDFQQMKNNSPLTPRIEMDRQFEYIKVVHVNQNPTIAQNRQPAINDSNIINDNSATSRRDNTIISFREDAEVAKQMKRIYGQAFW